MKNCKYCAHFEPLRSEKTNIILAGGYGDCTAPIIWPIFPEVFRVRHEWKREYVMPEIPRRHTAHSDGGLTCARFQDKPEKPTAKQEKLL